MTVLATSMAFLNSFFTSPDLPPHEKEGINLGGTAAVVTKTLAADMYVTIAETATQACDALDLQIDIEYEI